MTIIRAAVKNYLLCMKSRREVPLAYTLPAIISMTLACRGIPPLWATLKLFISIIFVAYGVYFYNDIMDVEDDLKNKELGNPIPASRPLASGKISRRMMFIYTFISLFIGLTLAFLINLKVFFILSIYIILGILYSTEPIKLKKRFPMKRIVIASGIALTNLAGAYAVGAINPAILYLTILNFAIFAGVGPIVDIRDIKGDRVIGVKTIPIVLGPEMTVRLAIGVLIASNIATILGYSKIGFNIVMPILFSLVIITWIYVMYPLMKRWSDPIYLNKIIQKRILPLFLILQIIMLIGILSPP